MQDRVQFIQLLAPAQLLSAALHFIDSLQKMLYNLMSLDKL